MNKFLSVVMLFLFSPILEVSARDNAKITVRCAAFYHTSERFRHIYGDVGPCFEIESSVPLPLYSASCAPYELWANFDWFSKETKVDHSCKTRARIANISTGIKYVRPFCNRYDMYLGAGLSVGKIYLSNRSCCESEHLTKTVAGGILKSGVRSYFCRSIYTDLFLDYLYQPVNYERRVDIGGVKIGLGLGVLF